MTVFVFGSIFVVVNDDDVLCDVLCEVFLIAFIGDEDDAVLSVVVIIILLLVLECSISRTRAESTSAACNERRTIMFASLWRWFGMKMRGKVRGISSVCS